MRNLVLGLAWVLCSTLSTDAASATDDEHAWVRLELRHAAARVHLPATAIDYGTFAWMPLRDVPDGQFHGDTQRVDHPFRMTFGGRSFDPAHHFPDATSGWFAPTGSSGADFRLIQFQGPIKAEWMTALRTAGVKPIQYVHPFSYIVWAAPSQLETARAIPRVRFSGEFLPAFRVPEQSRDSTAQHGQAMALVYGEHQSEVLAAMRQTGAQVIATHEMTSYFSLVELRAMPDRFLALARIPGVYTLQAITQDVAPRGEMSNQAVVGGYDDASHVIFPGYLDWLTPTGLSGLGVIVGIVDGGIRISHQDLVDRMVPCVSAGGTPTSCSTSNDDHGTHVAGAVAGTGASGVTDAAGFLRGQGVAPGASLVQQRYDSFTSGLFPGGMVPEGMLTIFKESALSGALLTNNSWGPSGTPQGYNIPTMHVDMISRDALPDVPGQQPVLAVWSVMNGNGDGNGACAPSSLGAPDEAKNLLAVGSTQLQNNSGTQAPAIFDVSVNSGHGPACDGRLVPHIVAPGCRTDSAHSASDTAFALFCGTSMASPVISGAVALFAEQYRKNHDKDPSPALIKAVFSATATDLVGQRNADNDVMGHRPDRFQGWGRLDLDRVINLGMDVWLLDQTEIFTATGQAWQATLIASDPEQAMHIMLAWTDAPGPGTGGTTPAWVNDLDLAVETVGAVTYLGNVFDPDTGTSTTAGNPDHRNNLEGIVLSPAQHDGGPIAITVLAANIAADALDPWDPDPTNPRQDFALACLNCVQASGFSLTITPDSAEICIPDAIDFTIDIGSISNFDLPVTLAITEAPPGVETSIGASPIIPPGATTLTVTVPDGTPPGAGSVVVEASAVTGTHSQLLPLWLFDSAPATTTLQLPIDGATEQSVMPTLVWDAATQAGTYLIQVADDPGFANIVFETITANTEIELASQLATGTTYWWRVHASNACDVSSSVTFSFSTETAPGHCPIGQDMVTLFTEDFTAGSGGFNVGGSGAGGWVLSNARPSPLSGGNAFFAPNPSSTSDQHLTTPPIQLPADGLPLTLTYQNWREIEQRNTTSCWDGGILEVSVDGDAFFPVDEAALLNDPYRGLVQEGTSNVLGGLQAWCDVPARPWGDTRVDLSAFAGNEVRLRWRLGSDSSVSAEGWYIDDVRIQACAPVGGADLSITKEIDIAEPDMGDTVVFTITAYNAGPDDATGVVVQDMLPLGYAFVSASASTGNYDENSGEWTIGHLDHGNSETLSITTTVTPFDAWLNTATVIADQVDPILANNSASVSASPQVQSAVFVDGFEQP